MFLPHLDHGVDFVNQRFGSAHAPLLRNVADDENAPIADRVSKFADVVRIDARKLVPRIEHRKSRSDPNDVRARLRDRLHLRRKDSARVDAHGLRGGKKIEGLSLRRDVRRVVVRREPK